MAEDTEYIKLPLQQRCTHKLWKARVHGFTEAIKLFQEEEDDKAAIFGQYAGLLGKFVGDSNAVAQEKGLEATLCFVQNSALAGKTAKEVISVIVAKSIGAPKKSTQDLSSQIALMYIEVEKQEVVVEELVKGLDHKNPKIVAACLTVLTTSLKEFGAQVVGIKPLFKPVLGLLENRDKTVRDEAKVLIVEIYRWVGEGIKPQLSKLQPIQLSELEAEFAKVKGEKAVPTRYLRSQQAKQAKAIAEVGGDIAEGNSPVGAEVEVDPLSLIDALNILAKIPNGFYEKLEAKKWQERKEAVEGLEQILDYPKFEKGDYGDLVRALLKVITKDTNVVVVGIATKCLARLASGLKKGFQPYANATLPQLLAKFKEKKANVVTPLREAVDAVFVATTLEAIQEDVIASLDNKNPSIKAETAAFMGRSFAVCTPAKLNKKILKLFATALLKTLNESDPTVRDSSAEALGVAMKVVGEKVILPFLPDIDPLKLAKIKEFCDKAVVKAAPVAPVNAAPVKPTVAPPPKEAPKKVLSGGATKIQAAKVNKIDPVVEQQEISCEEIDEKAAEYLPEDVLKEMASTDWKVRLEKIEAFQNVLTNMEPNSVSGEVMTKVLSRKPGFKDNNFQVLKIKLDCLKHIAESFPMNPAVVSSVIADVTEKLGDPKNGTLAGETLMALAEAANLDIVGSSVLEYAFSQKSVKVQQESLDWTGEAIQNFGLILSSSTVISYMKKGLNSTNSGVRQASAALAGIVSMYLGDELLNLLDEKPAAVSLVSAEMEKRVGEEPLEPSRTCKISRPAEPVAPKRAEAPQVEEEEPIEKPAKEEKSKPAARVDISPKITSELLAELGDKLWKVRGEALTNLQNIVNEAKAIKSNLGELPAALVLRFVDSNAKLTVMALELCTSLALAMGPGAKNQVRNFARGIFLALGDNKAYVRAAALTCLNAWATEAGGKEFFSGEIIPDCMKTGSTYLKVELWTWLGEILPSLKGVSKDELNLLLPHLYTGLEDRSPDIRKAANSAVLGMMVHLGYSNMVKEAEKLKPASRPGILLTLEKNRPEVPDSPPKGKPDPKVKAATKTVQVKSKQEVAPTATKPSARKKEEDVDTSPLLQINKLKHQRMNDEIKLKVLKWNFTSPRPEYVELLREQMTAGGFNKNLMNNMMHSDFKFHLKALDSLFDDLDNEDALIANLDLILKWLTLRFSDTNPSVILKGLEYLQVVFGNLISSGYSMSDIEFNSFIPYLVMKVGDPKDAVRDRVHAIMKQCSQMYSPGKLFLLIMGGLKSKNSRQRAECLEELGYLIESFGMSVCLPTPAAALKEISKQIADRDNAVRSGALNAIVKAYFQEGDKVYKMVGKLSDKDLSYLEERIKRASQNRKKEEESMMIPQKEMRRVPERIPEPEPEPEEDEIPPEEKIPEIEEKVILRQVSPQKPAPSSFKFPEIPKTEIPKLELIEIDYSILEEPISIPESILRRMEKAPPSNPLIEDILRQSSSATLEIAHEGLRRLYSTIVSPELTEAMVLPYIKNFIKAINSQFKACNQYNIQTSGLTLGSVYKAMLRTIGEIFGKSAYALAVDENELKPLLHEMMYAYVENKTVNFQEGGYNQWIKIFMVKILSSADRTAMTCATINELYDLTGSPPRNPKMTEMATNCLLRMIKVLKTSQPDDQTINPERVLLACHTYLQAYPKASWGDRPTDLPLKGVKTFLMHMVQMKGPDVLLHLGNAQIPLTSELAVTLKRLLTHQPTSKMTKAMTEHLAEAFLKIASEETVKEGMTQLYEFKKCHPNVDLTPMMAATSKEFQDFVGASLKEIEKERGPLKASLETSVGHVEPSTSTTATGDLPTDGHDLAVYYLKRLREHQARYGYPLTTIPGLECDDANYEQVLLRDVVTYYTTDPKNFIFYEVWDDCDLELYVQ